MNHEDAEIDETETVGGSMIRLNFREWTMAPQFEYLNGTPTSETETCDTLTPDAVAVERHALKGGNAKRFISTAFSSFEEFKKRAVKELVFFHVFEGNPSAAVQKLLSTCQENECILLLDVGNDRGFLKNTPIKVSVTADSHPVSKPLGDLRGLGAWAKGMNFGFEENEAAFESFISTARAFAHANR
jgi:hypothetical protein